LLRRQVSSWSNVALYHEIRFSKCLIKRPMMPIPDSRDLKPVSLAKSRSGYCPTADDVDKAPPMSARMLSPILMPAPSWQFPFPRNDVSKIKTLDDLVGAYRVGNVSKAVADETAIKNGWAGAQAATAAIADEPIGTRTHLCHRS
jgi:hypothetical protein